MGGNGGWYKCKPDPRSSMPPSALWPHGTCCNGGGSCSKPSENKHRYVLENANPKLIGNHRVFEVHLKIPPSVESCERCVIQWTYQTANSRETYPETFWNCADIKIVPASDSTTVLGCDSGENDVAPLPTAPPVPELRQRQHPVRVAEAGGPHQKSRIGVTTRGRAMQMETPRARRAWRITTALELHALAQLGARRAFCAETQRRQSVQEA